MLMAAARLNLPSVFLYGGSILPGHHNGQALDIVSCSRPSAPTRPGTSTTPSSTPSSATPARPRAPAPACSPPTPWRRWPRPRHVAARLASPPAVDRRRDDFAYESGQAVVNLLEKGIRPRQIMTKEAFENAIAVVMALGGSTNAVLHLLAIAHEAASSSPSTTSTGSPRGCPTSPTPSRTASTT
jgi:dihydroxy-acid dehydratase